MTTSERQALIDGLVGGDGQSRRDSRRKLSAALEPVLIGQGANMILRDLRLHGRSTSAHAT